MRGVLVGLVAVLAGCAGGKDTGACGDDGSGNTMSASGAWYGWRFSEPDPTPTGCEPAASQFTVACSGDTITLEVAYISASYDSDGDADEKEGGVVVRLGGELGAGNNKTHESTTSGVSINHEGATGLGPTSEEDYTNTISLSAYEAGVSADGAYVGKWIDPVSYDLIAEASGSFTVACP